MNKKNLFGFKNLDRVPLQTIGLKSANRKVSTKSLVTHKVPPKPLTQSTVTFKPSLDKKPLKTILKNPSAGKLGVLRSSGIASPGQNLSHRKQVSDTPQSEPPKKNVGVTIPETIIKQSRTSMSTHPIQSTVAVERKSAFSEKNVKAFSVDNSKAELVSQFESVKVKPEGITDFSSKLGMPFQPPNDLIIHEYHLESIKQRNQIENLKTEIANASEFEVQKASEVNYLAQKTITMATDLAAKESEILQLKRQISLANQQHETAKALNSQTQTELLKIRQENNELKSENDKLVFSLKKELLDKESLDARLREKDSNLVSQSTMFSQLTRDKEVLVGLVEKLRLELMQLKKSNEDALVFLMSR
jgi:hypothetical protein